MVIELITSITLLQTSFSLHRANPSEGADTSFQTSEPSRAYKHRVVSLDLYFAHLTLIPIIVVNFLIISFFVI